MTIDRVRASLSILLTACIISWAFILGIRVGIITDDIMIPSFFFLTIMLIVLFVMWRGMIKASRKSKKRKK